MMIFDKSKSFAEFDLVNQLLFSFISDYFESFVKLLARLWLLRIIMIYSSFLNQPLTHLLIIAIDPEEEWLVKLNIVIISFFYHK